MKWLTRQEQTVLLALIVLVFLGLAVKTYRTATVPPPARLPAAAP
jgi:hypothetical protein